MYIAGLICLAGVVCMSSISDIAWVRGVFPEKVRAFHHISADFSGGIPGGGTRGLAWMREGRIKGGAGGCAR
jgi:hypothetical protein